MKKINKREEREALIALAYIGAIDLKLKPRSKLTDKEINKILRSLTMNIEYFVNKEKGVVVAKMRKNTVKYEITKLVETIGLKSCFDIPFGTMYGFVNDLAEDLVAKAVCSEDDTFDEEIGKQVARRKLLNKLDKKKRSYIKRGMKDCISTYAKLLEQYNKVDKYIREFEPIHENDL